MGYSLAPDNEWEAPEIDYNKSINIYMGSKGFEERLKRSGFVPGINSRGIDFYIKRPF